MTVQCNKKNDHISVGSISWVGTCRSLVCQVRYHTTNQSLERTGVVGDDIKPLVLSPSSIT